MKILCLDGGGVRGLISLRFLAELEQTTGQTIPELFDFFGGTSIGAIIVSLFAYKKYSAKIILEQILTRDKLLRICPESLLDSVFGVVQFQPKYQNSQLKTVLEELLGTVRLSETDKKVMITGFDLEKHRPIFFKNYFDSKDGDTLVSDICTVSASAPLYFAPHYLVGRNLWGIDGGMANNNPSDGAIIDAISLCNGKIDLLSVGTGYSHSVIDASSSPDWGLLDWVTKGKLIDLMMGGSIDSSDYRARSLCKALNHRYVRIQHAIPENNLVMDNFSIDNLDQLQQIALDWWTLDKQRVVETF